MNIIRVHYNGEKWCVGFGRGDQFGSFKDAITAINFALDKVAERLDLPVQWPESVILA